MDFKIRASHILIGYQGALRTTATRTKAETRELAERVLAELKAGADFAEAARQYSDGPTATRRGELGCLKTGQMIRPFETAAFGLEVDESSEVASTPFGFHIILRTE